MFFLASAYAASSSVCGTSSFDARAFAIRISWRMRSLRRFSLAVRVSSSESGCAGSWTRRYALSTSLRMIGRPSTTAHVSAETAGSAGAAGVERQAVAATLKATTIADEQTDDLE